jgi:hypothetical protein
MKMSKSSLATCTRYMDTKYMSQSQPEARDFMGGV